jgi:hypothetical protein
MLSTLTLMTALAALTGPGPAAPAYETATRTAIQPRPVIQQLAFRPSELADQADASRGVQYELAQAPAAAASSSTQATTALPSSADDVTSRQPRGEEPASQPRSDFVMLQDCLVSLIDDLDVTAQEDGLLISLEAREGMDVRKDMQLAQIDDRDAKAKYAAAAAAHTKAKEQSENNVNERFAEAAARVAQAEYDMGLRANREFATSVATAEMQRRKLAWDKAVLGIEQAKVEQALTRRETEVKAAELEQAKLAIERRKVICPWSGQVVEVKKRAGAWVTRSEALLRMVRMDRLRVAGHVKADNYGPQEISGRQVSIRATLERGRVERFTGKIAFVHPEQSGGDYLVWAEVDNRQQGDQWVLRPGLHVDMAIHLAAPEVARKPRE